MAAPTQGDVFSHASVGTDDIVRAARFYDAVLAPLGLVRHKTHKLFAGYGTAGFDGINAPFWLLRPYDRKTASPGNGPMMAFVAPDRAAVDAFHTAALAGGGSDEGAPGLRPHYHADYYAAYVRDPEGNKLCAVCHLPEAVN